MRSAKNFSASKPGPKSATSDTAFLMPFLVAHSAIGTVACGSVKLVRTMNGDASVIADVPAAITTIGVLLCVAIGAVAIAAGVTPKPASTVTLSLTTSSCARRRDVSGTAASSLMITCDRLAAGLGAVLRLPQLDRGVDLPAGGGLLAGHRQDQADLHGVRLRVRPRHHGQAGGPGQQAAL